MGAGFRAFFTVWAVCALLFGAMVSGFNSAAHAAPTAQGAAFSVMPCHEHMAAAAASDSPAHSRKPSSPHGCPACCLLAHTGSAAVLPQRAASFARPMRETASRVRYFALTTREDEPAVTGAANGARAPPLA